MIRRPKYQVDRQIRGAYFGEPATLVKIATTRNEFGEPESTETPVKTTLATSPVTRGDARTRTLGEQGVALTAMREFWLVEQVEPAGEDTEGDIIEYDGERWRVRMVSKWAGFNAVIAVRQEGQ